MKENGEWLNFVNSKYRTPEVCLAAVRQTATAKAFRYVFRYVPRVVIDENPEFYEIGIERDPSIITQVPDDKLTS